MKIRHVGCLNSDTLRQFIYEVVHESDKYTITLVIKDGATTYRVTKADGSLVSSDTAEDIYTLLIVNL